MSHTVGPLVLQILQLHLQFKLECMSEGTIKYYSQNPIFGDVFIIMHLKNDFNNKVF